MTKEMLIQQTLSVISKLPKEKIIEIADFADFILKKYEDDFMQKSLQKINAESKAFSFLNDEEEIYTVEDLKENYNEKR